MTIGRRYLAARLAVEYQFGLLVSRLRWKKLAFDGSPVLFANAMAKSGSKLLMQIMQGIQKLGPFAPVSMWPIRMLDGEGRVRSDEDIARQLASLRAGDIRLGYLHATGPILDSLTQPDWCSFFLFRDPRDLLISHIHYSTDIHKGDSMRPIYARLPDFASRLEIAIQGTEDYPYLPDVFKRYERYLPFLQAPGVCVLRFEELRSDPDGAIRRVLEHITSRSGLAFAGTDRAVAGVKSAINPSRSPTFRKGAAGEWREVFTDGHKRLFKEVAGDLLIRLGYEQGEDW
jgi:sulfotransferase 6B1